MRDKQNIKCHACHSTMLGPSHSTSTIHAREWERLVSPSVIAHCWEPSFSLKQNFELQAVCPQQHRT